VVIPFGLLNEALATGLVCVLRYKRYYFMAKGIHGEIEEPARPAITWRGSGKSNSSRP